MSLKMPPKHDLPLPHSKPIKATLSSTFPFTTTHKYCVESHMVMALKVRKYIVGSMPPQTFLNEFLLIHDIPSLCTAPEPQFKPGHYAKVVAVEGEKSMYNPFVSFLKCLLYTSS
jgi:hypothetical protein